MRVFKPRGVTIYWNPSVKRGPKFDCSIKSQGRTGAAVRSRLMQMTREQRDPILSEWSQRRAVEL